MSAPFELCAATQVPQGAFVFLNDADFLPSKRMYEDLTTGLWAPELGRMRDAYNTEGRRITFVAPAFERLAAAGPGGGRGRKRPVPFRGECTSATGCEVLQGMALPRTFKSLRSMMQVAAVDVFHRPQVRATSMCTAASQFWRVPLPIKHQDSEQRAGKCVQSCARTHHCPRGYVGRSARTRMQPGRAACSSP